MSLFFVTSVCIVLDQVLLSVQRRDNSFLREKWMGNALFLKGIWLHFSIRIIIILRFCNTGIILAYIFLRIWLKFVFLEALRDPGTKATT